MEIMGIIFPVMVIGGLGVLLGAALGVAGKLLAVETDPRVALVRDALPGANCAGCGYTGCDAFASAVVEGKAKVSGCPVGGAACAEKIASVMGVDANADERMVAFVKCKGDCNVAVYRYDYRGIEDCNAVMMLPGSGSKSCQYGCVGNGSCAARCQFGAITIKDGIAKVDPEKCTACTMCINTCPRNLIELVPASKVVRVNCQSKDPGREVKQHCIVGCIGCKLCERACKYDAIHVADNIAHVDYDKCTLCGECVKKCPVKVIDVVGKLPNELALESGGR